jgi:hypothetical protein
LGGTYGVSSFFALFFSGTVVLDVFVVMTVQFYNLRMQRYNLCYANQFFYQHVVL